MTVDLKDSLDDIKNPSHYKNENASQCLQNVRALFCEDGDIMNMECIQAMVNMFNSFEEVRGYLRGNIFKYQWRYREKGKVTDLYKANRYQNWLIKVEIIGAEYYPN